MFSANVEKLIIFTDSIKAKIYTSLSINENGKNWYVRCFSQLVDSENNLQNPPADSCGDREREFEFHHAAIQPEDFETQGCSKFLTLEKMQKR